MNIPSFRCGVCRVELESPNSALQHYSSSRHAKQLQKLKETGVLRTTNLNLEKLDSEVPSKEVLPLLSSMTVDHSSRRVRQGGIFRDGISSQNEPEKSQLKDNSSNSENIAYKATRLIVMDTGKRPLPFPSKPSRLSESDLTSIFQPFNPTKVEATGTSGRRRALGYVDFSSASDAAAAREALNMTRYGDFTLGLKWEKKRSSNLPHSTPPTTLEPVTDGASLSPSPDDKMFKTSTRQMVDDFKSKRGDNSWKHQALDHYVNKALKDSATLEQWMSELQPGSKVFKETEEGLGLIKQNLETNLREAKRCWFEVNYLASYLEHISSCLGNPKVHSIINDARSSVNEVIFISDLLTSMPSHG